MVMMSFLSAHQKWKMIKGDLQGVSVIYFGVSSFVLSCFFINTQVLREGPMRSRQQKRETGVWVLPLGRWAAPVCPKKRKAPESPAES